MLKLRHAYYKSLVIPMATQIGRKCLMSESGSDWDDFLFSEFIRGVTHTEHLPGTLHVSLWGSGAV